MGEVSGSVRLNRELTVLYPNGEIDTLGVVDLGNRVEDRRPGEKDEETKEARFVNLIVLHRLAKKVQRAFWP
jgi:hypothetical protein